MTHRDMFRRFRRPLTVALLALCVVLAASQGFAQPKYRTFSQINLAEKKAKAGKPIAGELCFTFYNPTGDTVNGLIAKCNAHILSVDSYGGFASIVISDKGKLLTATGIAVEPGDSATICITVDKKAPGAKMTSWYWTHDGIQEGQKHDALLPASESRIFIEPNGGNMLEYLYKRVVSRPEGIVMGMPRPDSAKSYGWIRYMKADRKYFPHAGDPRCFDFIMNGSGSQKPFVKQLKNPHVKKHDNHLLGELHALKLAVIANDSGVTEPLDSLSNALGDLLYDDAGNPTDPLNGMTIRGIMKLVDSSLTYCTHFDTGAYAALDAGVSRINAAFDGPYLAASFSPFILAGTHTLAEAAFLHPNPSVMPIARATPPFGIADLAPEQFALAQNYPNPFNPSTTIDFMLPQASLVSLKIYNMLGQEVATLLDRSELDEGEQTVTFDASGLASGIYLYRIVTLSNEGGQAFQQVKRMLLVK